MPMYNLLEYSDNYSDTLGSLWNFKRDEIEEDADLTINNASSFKYKANLMGNTVADGANRKKENVKIAVPLKYLSIFWRSLEMPLINCKVEFSLGCLLDFAYFGKNYKIIAADLSKRKALDADSRAIQQIIFTGHADAQIRVYYILEQLKEAILEFSKRTTKVL